MYVDLTASSGIGFSPRVPNGCPGNLLLEGAGDFVITQAKSYLKI